MRIRRIVSWAAAWVAACLFQPVVAQPATGKTALKLPEVVTWQLDNGMRVAFMRVEAAPVVAVEVWYHAGSKDEPRDRRGSAHMFEHMMFKGTEHVRPEDHARFVNGVGGYANASTTEDATFYTNVVPSDYLDFACQLEAERMRKLLFRDSMIATEREVVKEEIRQAENSPFTKGFLRFLEIAYTAHPYAWTAGGTLADLDATTVANLRTFYDAYYVPNNAMLVVVGDVEEGQVRAAADRWFAPIPRGAEPPRPADAATEPAQEGKRREVVDPGMLGLVIAGFHVPAASHEDIYALQVASLLLGAGESSRLHSRLVRTDKVANQVGSTLLAREHPGLLVLFGLYLDPANTEKVEAALMAEVARLRKTPPTVNEVRKAKNQLQSAYAFGLEGVADMSRQIGMSWIETGDPARWRGDLAKYGAVTIADVRRVVNKYLIENNATIVVVPPARGPAKPAGARPTGGQK